MEIYLKYGAMQKKMNTIETSLEQNAGIKDEIVILLYEASADDGDLCKCKSVGPIRIQPPYDAVNRFVSGHKLLVGVARLDRLGRYETVVDFQLNMIQVLVSEIERVCIVSS